MFDQFGEQRVQRCRPDVIRVELGTGRTLQDDLRIRLRGGHQAHRPAAIKTGADLAQAQHGGLAMPWVEQDAVVQRIDDQMVPLQALQEDAIGQCSGQAVLDKLR